MRRLSTRVLLLLTLLATLSLAGCSGRKNTLREWRPDDHGQPAGVEPEPKR